MESVGFFLRFLLSVGVGVTILIFCSTLPCTKPFDEEPQPRTDELKFLLQRSTFHEDMNIIETQILKMVKVFPISEVIK
jgi:hypothetical protein